MSRPHILLLALDTLRRDHLGCYGHPRDVSPHIDRLAAEGVLCRDSVANCGWTLPQHMTLMTGLYPHTHDVVLWDNPPLHDEWTTLAEHLKANGYRTMACCNVNRFGGGGDPAQFEYGFRRGFDEHTADGAFEAHMQWTEDWVVDRWRRHCADGPVFVYVHINDTHEPYDAPQPFKNMWGRTYRELYEGDISYVDHHLGRIFDALEETGTFDDTLICVFSDHGTEFWEHEFIEKKCNLYREILDVPLIFRYPRRVPAGRAVDGLAESANVLPTLLDLAGLPPMEQAQAPSLAPRILGAGGRAPGFVVAHTVHNHQREFGPPQFDHVTVYTERYKFNRARLLAEPDALHSDWKQRFQAMTRRAGGDPGGLRPGSEIRELFDLRVDPEEHFNCLNERAKPRDWRVLPFELTEEQLKEEAAALEAVLDEWVADKRALRKV